MINKAYKGIRVQITALLDTIVQHISIDIGFGDVITPNPILITYPTLLAKIPDVKILSYSLETVVAEKIHAMVVLENENSRMKDFFDVFQILSNQNIDYGILKQAIFNTFRNRQGKITSNIIIFTDGFANDPIRLKFWRGFLKRIKWSENLDFHNVMQLIREKVSPIFEELCKIDTGSK